MFLWYAAYSCDIDWKALDIKSQYQNEWPLQLLSNLNPWDTGEKRQKNEKFPGKNPRENQ